MIFSAKVRIATEISIFLGYITHTVLVESDGANITLVTIYDKSDQASISNRELRKLMKKNGLE